MTRPTQQSQSIQYDFNAAGNLSAALAQFRSSLEDLASTRSRLHTTDLVQKGEWKGRHRDDFDADFKVKQGQLTTLIDTLNTIQTQVRQATTDAVRAQRLLQMRERTGA
jgi:uncharacterized protein YukE